MKKLPTFAFFLILALLFLGLHLLHLPEGGPRFAGFAGVLGVGVLLYWLSHRK